MTNNERINVEESFSNMRVTVNSVKQSVPLVKHMHPYVKYPWLYRKATRVDYSN